MHNPDFFPTPSTLIYKLFDGIKVNSLTYVLEPSAGKGDICEWLTRQRKYDSYSTFDLDTIEIAPDLQHILRGKEYRVVHDDFLTFHTYKPYDLIVANFPFSAGAEHLNHALNLLEENGGMLRCLVNAETLRNPCTVLRRSIITRLEMLGAEIEYLADQFKSAERTTGVEVALIRVKVERQESSVLLNTMKAASTHHDAPSNAPQDLVSTNLFGEVLANYDFECRIGIGLINEQFAMRPYLRDCLKRPDDQHDYSKPMIKLEIGGRGYDCKAEAINEYLRLLRHKYWTVLIRDSGFTGHLTSNIIKELEAKLVELRNYDFTLFNIHELEKEIESKIKGGVRESILKMFDEFSSKHHWSEECNNNTHYYNGWKTNQAHKINKKIILPINGTEASYSKGQQWNYYIKDRLHDIVKVFNYLAKDRVNPLQLVGSAMRVAEAAQDFTVDMRFFKARFFKKGTCHIWFLDQELLDKFNIYGSQRKGWLPPSYGKAHYQDMSQEERAVIDEFQGKEAYAEVMRNAAYYLADAGLPQLTSGTPPPPPPPPPAQPKPLPVVVDEVEITPTMPLQKGTQQPSFF